MEFKFSSLPKASGTVANIFIHGYSAGHSLEDRQLLLNSIPASLQNCVNIFAFWPSSHFSRVDNLSRNFCMAASRIHPAAGAAAFAGDRVIHFTRIRARAEAMGKVLLEQLNDYLFDKHRSVTTINLIGHSLGGRLVASTLTHLTRPPEGLSIGDVLLMAAAVKVEPAQAQQMRRNVGGRMINAYSKDDWILHLNLGENSLGRNEVEHFENIRIPDFGHGHYWEKLAEVMARTQFSGYQPGQLSTGVVVGTGDHVIKDSVLYKVLEQSPAELTQEAIKHLKSSSWTDIKDGEKDQAYAFARELQLVGGHCLVNVARGRGISYSQVLSMLTDHYELGSQLHKCGNIIETEELLVKSFFRHAFPDGHPLSRDPLANARAMSRDTYFKHIDALAERLTVASYFKSPSVAVDMTDPGAGTAVSSGAVIGFTRSSMLGLLGEIAKKPMSRLVTNVKTALKPGYSALIPAVAIVFYARLMLDDEGLM
ncbi:DUF726 domain-containing protein [Pseudomonas sp. SZMC_28357]|uniref:DUF726 domain-containing protein n=1 Tax=Pseudomonas sp. SZMC_28357 TaxID=3074380 RepID=UPI002870EE5A|nr:DUF726 domain-containing protein [Pseudomonas sp. SZMC_28357]MDR9752957.1 DUF726 domain-containing protein [Pseudomonas sp. SZMC_28357]